MSFEDFLKSRSAALGVSDRGDSFDSFLAKRSQEVLNNAAEKQYADAMKSAYMENPSAFTDKTPQPAPEEPSAVSSIADIVSPSKAWKGLKMFASNALDDLKNAPATLNYPFAKIAEYAVPDAPLIGRRPDGSYGNLDGTNARQSFQEANPTTPTNDEFWNKAADLVGQLAGPLVGTYGTGMGSIPGMVDNALARASVQFGDGIAGKVGKGIVEGTLSGYPMNAAATLATQDPSLSDLARAGNEGALIGAGFGAAGPFLAGVDPALNAIGSKVSQRVGDQMAFRKAAQDFIDRTQATPPAESAQPAFPSSRMVMELPQSGEARPGKDLADNFNRGQSYQQPSSSLPEGVQAMTMESQKPLPEVTDNYLKPLSHYSERLYRETSPDQALELIPGSNVYTNTSQSEYFFSNDKDLALGQGNNKGVLIEFRDPKNIQGQVNTSKPGWDLAYRNGSAEFKSKYTSQKDYQDAVHSVTIMKDAKMDKVTKVRLRNILSGWDRIENPDGSISYFRPKPKSASVETAQPMQYQQGDRNPASGSANPESVQPMRAEPIKFRNAPVQNDRTITRKSLFDGIRQRHGVTIRTGRLGVGNQGVLGYFKTRSEVIRTRRAGDVQVAAHEVGHALDKRYKLANPQYDTELLPLGAVTSGKSYTIDEVRAEGIAEYLRLYFTDPQRAYQEAPNFTSYLLSKLPDKELRALQQTQLDIDTWITQGGANRLRGQINRTGKDTSQSIGDRAHSGYTAAVDKLHPLAQAEVEIRRNAKVKAEQQLKDLTDKEIRKIERSVTLNDGSSSLYKKARLVAGAPRKAELFIDENLKPILTELGEKGYSLADLGDYATAKHAMEIERAWQLDFKQKVKEAAAAAQAAGKKLTLDDIRRIKEDSQIESGFVRGDIQDTIQKFDTPEMQAIHQKLMTYNQKLIDMLVKGQVLSREAADAMRAKYPDYVPFYRYFDEDGGAFFGGGGKGFADLANPIKRLKGSTRDIIDPVESIIKNTFAAVQAVEKNKVGLELAKLSQMEGAGALVERLTGDTRSPKENIVTVFENGERVQYQLDPELYRAIKQLDEESANFLVKMFAVPASILRAGATLTPEFILRNPIRDQFQAFVVSKYGYNPIIDLPAGIFHAVFKGKYYKEWVEAGGAHGQMVSMDRNILRQKLRELKDERSPWARRTVAIVNPKQWLQLLQRLSEISEEGTKIGEFRRAVKRGATPEEAAYQSRDLMDFSRVGNNVQQINRNISFLNANIQGKDRLIRAFKNNPVRTTIRAITAVTMPTIGSYYWNNIFANDKQREIIDNAPQWLKDTFFLVAVPGTDVVARIPKPFDLAPVFSNWVEEALRFADGKQHLSPGDTVKYALKEFGSMPFFLTGLTPWIENWSNKSFFTGGPVVPRRDEDLLPEDQYGNGTSLTARSIGKAINYSPYKVDNVIRGYAAGLGKYATAGTDAILKATGAGNTPPEEAKKISELPVINAFTVNYSGGKTVDDFYQRLDEMSRVEASNAKNKVIDDQAKQVSDDFQRTNREIGKLRAQMRDVQGSYEIPPKEKRARIDDLDNQITQLAAAALERNKSYTRR